MRNAVAVFLVMALMVSCGLSARAQDDAKKDTPTAKAEPPAEPYRLDFSFNELADGKIVNSRHYSMNLTKGEADEIKIGTRVPVVSASNGNASASVQYQYVDVGTSIWAQLRPRNDVLVVRGEVSNLDMSASTEHTPMTPPIVRQIKLDGETVLVTGKPIVIGSVDDPNSKRSFQLEVTVTKLH